MASVDGEDESERELDDGFLGRDKSGAEDDGGQRRFVENIFDGVLLVPRRGSGDAANVVRACACSAAAWAKPRRHLGWA